MKKETTQEAAEYKLMMTNFGQFYWAQKGASFSWDGKQIGNLKLIQKRLIKLIKTTKANQEQKAEEEVELAEGEVVNTFDAMLKAIITAKQLKWVKDNLNPAIINNKFNEVIAAANNLRKENYGDLLEELSTQKQEVRYEDLMLSDVM